MPGVPDFRAETSFYAFDSFAVAGFSAVLIWNDLLRFWAFCLGYLGGVERVAKEVGSWQLAGAMRSGRFPVTR
jgi:hypothetical protein